MSDEPLLSAAYGRAPIGLPVGPMADDGGQSGEMAP